jgi:hypothetical protein
MKEWIIDRDDQTDLRTYATVRRADGSRFSDLLELPWKNDAHTVSCIPGDRHYLADLIYSKAHKGARYCYRDVPGPTPAASDDRQGCEIHSANIPAQLEGCQAPGATRVPMMEIDGFPPMDGVSNSRETTNAFYVECGVPDYLALNTPELVAAFVAAHPDVATIGVQINNPPAVVVSE